MHTLVITDIPRISELFERIAAEQNAVTVVGELHRGIEQLDQLKPDLIIFQNHLSGLSADILLNHLKSRLNHRKARFALIAASDNLDRELSARFETILDPSLPDEQLKQRIHSLLTPLPVFPEKAPLPASSIFDLPPASQQEHLPGLTADQTTLTAPLSEDSATAPHLTVPVSELPSPAQPAEEPLPQPLTYDRPRRANRTIVSAFSQHLDSTVEEVTPRPATVLDRDDEYAIRDLHHEPHLAPDDDPGRPPLYRRAGFWLLVSTVILVLIVTVIQQRPRAPHTVGLQQPASLQQSTPSGKQSAAGQKPAHQHTAPPDGTLRSHGQGRPTALPSFIPQEGRDPGYAKDNPGWESFRGQANEYRVFREKDGSIKAVQVIDRSGAGIPDPYYISILKELAGVTAMRPTASEIKEGYEIRRGTVAGLELIQYRDAQGGRLRGIVITWP